MSEKKFEFLGEHPRILEATTRAMLGKSKGAQLFTLEISEADGSTLSL
jgi:hypothetical protein